MKQNIKRKLLLLALASCLGACASTGAPYPLPKYAQAYSLARWVVICGPGKRTYGDMNTRLIRRLFYKEDGSVKSREEFCAESTTGTRIRSATPRKR